MSIDIHNTIIFEKGEFLHTGMIAEVSFWFLVFNSPVICINMFQEDVDIFAELFISGAKDSCPCI